MALFKEGEVVVVHRNHGRLGTYYWGGRVTELPLFSEGAVMTDNGTDQVTVRIGEARKNFHPSEVVKKSDLESILALKDKFVASLPPPFLAQMANAGAVAVLNERIFYLTRQGQQEHGNGTLFFNGVSYDLLEMETLPKLEFLYRQVFNEGIARLEFQMFRDRSYAQQHIRVSQVTGRVRLLHNILAETLPHFVSVTEKDLADTDVAPLEKLLATVQQDSPQPSSIFSGVIGTSSALLFGNFVYQLQESGTGAEGQSQVYVMYKGKMLVPSVAWPKPMVFRSYQHAVLSDIEFETFTLKSSSIEESLSSAYEVLRLKIQEVTGKVDNLRFKGLDDGCVLSLSIPDSYALLDHKTGNHYVFGPVTLAVEVGVENGQVKFTGPHTTKAYIHPFVGSSTDICLGNYVPPKGMSVGHQIASYLIMARQVLLSGYLPDCDPYARLNGDKFSGLRISSSELERKGVRVTNVNFVEGRL